MIKKRNVIIGLVIVAVCVFLVKDFFHGRKGEFMEGKQNVSMLLEHIEKNGEKVDIDLDIGKYSFYKVGSGTMPEFYDWYAVKSENVVAIEKTADLAGIVNSVRDKKDALYLVKYTSSWIERPSGVLIVSGVSDEEVRSKLSAKEYGEYEALNLKGTKTGKDAQGNYVIERDAWAIPYKHEGEAPCLLVRIKEVVTPQGEYSITLEEVISRADWLKCCKYWLRMM